MLAFAATVALSMAAQAASPTEPLTFDAPVRLGVRAVGESVRDVGIGRVYGSTSLAGEASMVIGLPYGVEAGVQVGYRRIAGTEQAAQGAATGGATWIWYAPLSVTAGYGIELGVVNPYVAVGPSWVLWGEKPGTSPDVGYSGGKVGLTFEGGVRVPFGRPMLEMHHRPATPDQLGLTLSTAWRHSFRTVGPRCGPREDDAPCGLDFSAFRLALGLEAMF